MHLAAHLGCQRCEIRGGFFRFRGPSSLQTIGRSQMSQGAIQTRCIVSVGISIIFSWLFVASTLAGQINSTPAPVASGTGLGFVGVAAIITGAPNNDDATGTPSDSNI